MEINTYEHSSAMSLVRMPFEVHSRWYSGRADVLTFAPAELVATKIRALYERRKGRDLFDLWLALTELRVAPAEIVAAFESYRPYGYTRAKGIETLHEYLADVRFRNDLVPLVGRWPSGYDIDSAARLVRAELLGLIS